MDMWNYYREQQKQRSLDQRILCYENSVRWIKEKQQKLKPKIKAGGSIKEYMALERQKKEFLMKLKWLLIK